MKKIVAVLLLSTLALQPACARSVRHSSGGVLHHILHHTVKTAAKVATVAGGVVAGEYVYHALTDDNSGAQENDNEQNVEIDQSENHYSSHHHDSDRDSDGDSDDDTRYGTHKFGVTGP